MSLGGTTYTWERMRSQLSSVDMQIHCLGAAENEKRAGLETEHGQQRYVCIFPVDMSGWQGLFKYTPSEGQPWPNDCQLQAHSDCLFSLQLALKLCPE